MLGEIVSETDSMKRQVPKGFDVSGPGWMVKLENPDPAAENDDGGGVWRDTKQFRRFWH